MKVNPKYLIYHDLIGLRAYAKLKSKKKIHQNFANIGLVIDETENMLVTKKTGEKKQYMKKNYIFRFELPKNPDGTRDYLQVNGEKIVGRPENRFRSLKKKKRFIK